MVRYPFDLLRAVSEVEPLTTNGKSNAYRTWPPFALRYRRVNGDYEWLSDRLFSVISAKAGIQCF